MSTAATLGIVRLTEANLRTFLSPHPRQQAAVRQTSKVLSFRDMLW